MNVAQLGLPLTLAVFVAAAIAVLFAGLALTARAERLAAVTGLGQAVLGAVFLGAATSLSGTVTSVSAAWAGEAEIAYGNAIGGIAAQTTFLVIADFVYREVNLEHAAASEANLLQGVLLVVLLGVAQVAMFGPGWTLWGVDMASFALVAMYIFGVRLIARAHQQPMWRPKQTQHTAAEDSDAPAKPESGELTRLWLSFGVLALIVSIAGWAIAETGVALAERTGISKTLVGNVMTSVVTSMPELVVAIAAVRRGALTLAVGDILGGNGFDVLFLVLSDIAYRAGSIHVAVSDKQALWLSLSVLMVGVTLLGLLRRQRHGLGNVGFEGVLVLGLYATGIVLIVLG
jgi:cation:H+ antiporter